MVCRRWCNPKMCTSSWSWGRSMLDHVYSTNEGTRVPPPRKSLNLTVLVHTCVTVFTPTNTNRGGKRTGVWFSQTKQEKVWKHLWITSDKHYGVIVMNSFTFQNWSPFADIVWRMTIKPFPCEPQQCFLDWKASSNLPSAWGWVDNDWIFIFRGINHLK